jgi:hypothetical protein
MSDHGAVSPAFVALFQSQEPKPLETPPAVVQTAELQPPKNSPAENISPNVWDLVIADCKVGGAKDAPGDVLSRAYQEALNLCVFLRRAIHERDGK